MSHIVAIANQKGGVGKTTTAVNLAASLAIAERRTLLVDADPQGNATSGVGIAKHELDLSLYDVLVEDRIAREVILPVPALPHLSVLPATQDLVGAELSWSNATSRESRAARGARADRATSTTTSSSTARHRSGCSRSTCSPPPTRCMIPIQCEYYGLEGISQLLNTVRLVQQNFNPGLAISGVLLTMYDARLNLCRQVAEDAKEYFGAKVFVTPIPRNVRLAEAPSFGKPILLYDVQSVGAKSYLAVAQELMRRVESRRVESRAHRTAARGGHMSEDQAAGPWARSTARAGHPRAGRGLGRAARAAGDERPTQSLPAAHPDRRSPAHELAASMEASGLLQPIVVRPRDGGYELIAGERRWRAATRLGWTKIPAVVKDVDDQTLLTLALIENLQRDDLSPIDEASGYQRLGREFKLPQAEIARMVGRNRSTVANLLRLLQLPRRSRPWCTGAAVRRSRACPARDLRGPRP